MVKVALANVTLFRCSGRSEYIAENSYSLLIRIRLSHRQTCTVSRGYSTQCVYFIDHFCKKLLKLDTIRYQQ
jgi:hypothetical protein